MRDLPDGCVSLYECMDDRFSRCQVQDDQPTHLALPAPAFDALLDKAGRVEGLEADLADAKRDGERSFRGFQQVCFAMTGTTDALPCMDAIKPHDTAEAYAKALRADRDRLQAEVAALKGVLGEVRAFMPDELVKSDHQRVVYAGLLFRLDALLGDAR